MSSDQQHIAHRAALGAVAGFVGAVLLHAFRATRQRRALPEERSSTSEVPGNSLGRVALDIGAGMSCGALYALLRGAAGPTVADGLFVGAGSWAVRQVGQLPSTSSNPTAHGPEKPWRPLLEQAAFGVATVAGYHAMDRMDVLKSGS